MKFSLILNFRISFLKRSLIPMISVLLASLASCEQADKLQEPLVISFDTLSGEIDANGGYLRIPYSFSGPFYDEAGNPPAITAETDSEWITETVADVPGEIILQVAENNTGTERTAEIQVTYGPDTAIVSVTQTAKAGTDEEDTVFRIDITMTGDAYVVYDVTPADDGMTYINLVTTKAIYDSFANDDERFAYDMTYFSQVAQNNGLTLVQLLEMNLKQGYISSIEVNGLSPETEYCIYTYGLTSSGERLTGYTYETFSTEAVEEVDINFDFSSEIDGAHVVLKVTPSDNTVPYVIDAYRKAAGLDGEIIKELYQQNIDETINVLSMFGQSVEEIVKSIAHIGTDAVVADLDPDTEYIAFACGISLSGYLNSDVTTYEFRTGSTGTSDNVITITITSVSSDEVSYSITTTNNDQYAIIAADASSIGNMSDDEIIATALKTDLSSQTTRGNCSGRVPGLQPGKEYFIGAFGYSGSVATTGLSKAYFTTPEENAQTSASGQPIIITRIPSIYDDITVSPVFIGSYNLSLTCSVDTDINE